jgi:ABC-type transport system substrate-binding protein
MDRRGLVALGGLRGERGNKAITSTRRRSVGLIIACLALLLLVSCSPAEEGPDTEAGATTSATEGGGAASGPSGELVVATGHTGNHTWSPSQSGGETLAMAKHMHDSLVQVNPETQQLEGMLAESYSVSDDGLTWNFKLRPDIQFHDGWGTLTAEDVKYTWGEWMREDSNQNTNAQLREAIGGDLDNIEIVSDLEFNIHLAEPSYDLDTLLVHSYNNLFVTSKRYHEEDPNADDHPIGTGPWKFVSSTPGVEVVMEANTEYWGTVPSFERLVVKEIPDGSARLVQVQGGEVDMSTLDSALVREAEASDLQIIPAEDIGTLQVILGGMYYLPAGDPNLPKDQLDRDSPWIQADEPEKGLAIREAMSLAINRDQILETVLGGYGEVNYAPLIQYNANPELVDRSWELPAFDLEQARQKLAEGGYPNGFPVEMFLYQDEVDTMRVGEAIAGMWEELGLQVSRRPSEEDILDPLLNTRETDGMAFVKLQGNEPMNIVLHQYASLREDGDYKINHPIIDEGLEAYTSAPTQEQKYAVQRETATRMRDEMIIIPLYNVDLPMVVGPGIAAWSPVPGDKELNNLNTATPAAE